MSVRRKSQSAYGIGNPLIQVFNAPIISNRVPTVRDRAEIGTLWCYKDPVGGDNAYILTSITANASTWTSMGGGSGAFDAINVNPGNVTLVAGDVVVTAGDISVVAGGITLGAFAAAGVVINDAAGIFATSAGANGTVLIGTTAGAPVWSTLTAGGGINIAQAAGTITISNPGATGTSMTTTDLNVVVPDGGGNTDVLGYDANIVTDGATANTVYIRLANSITTVAAVTASTDLSMLSGSLTITADTNAPNAIYLNASGGAAETIHIFSQLGTSADCIDIEALAGGVTIASAFAGAASLTLDARNAAGGIEMNYGTGGMTIAGTNGDYTLETGTGNIYIGFDAAEKDVVIGNITTASQLALFAGTAGLVTTVTGQIELDCAGTLEINSTAGVIGIGNDPVAANINIGTGAAPRITTVGNATGASQVVLNCGTAGISIGESANTHTVVIGSVDTASALTLQTGTGAMTFTSGGIFDVNAVGGISIDSTGGALSFGAGADAQNIDIGTGPAARIITTGNASGATSIVLNAGTGPVEIGSNAVAHQVRVGSITGAANTTIQCGAGALIINGGAAVTVDAVGNLSIESSAGNILIGDDVVARNLSIGTGAAANVIAIGNDTGATSVNVDVGTGASSFAASATDHATEIGSVTGTSSTIINAGTDGILLNASGFVDVVVSEDTQAASAVTINANVGYATFTGLTTAAAASQVLTITNSICTTTSAILITAANLGANDAKMTVTRVIPAAGSFTVTVTNNGAASLNGNLTITFWLLEA